MKPLTPTNPKIPSVVSSWDQPMYQRAQSQEKDAPAYERPAAANKSIQKGHLPEISSSHSQASLFSFRLCLQQNEHITVEILLLICPLGVLLTLPRTIFKCAISWLDSFAVPPPLAACVSLAQNPISYYHPLNQRNYTQTRKIKLKILITSLLYV